jgi:hypothetical protein
MTVVRASRLRFASHLSMRYVIDCNTQTSLILRCGALKARSLEGRGRLLQQVRSNSRWYDILLAVFVYSQPRTFSLARSGFYSLFWPYGQLTECLQRIRNTRFRFFLACRREQAEVVPAHGLKGQRCRSRRFRFWTRRNARSLPIPCGCRGSAGIPGGRPDRDPRTPRRPRPIRAAPRPKARRPPSPLAGEGVIASAMTDEGRTAGDLRHTPHPPASGKHLLR